MRRLVIGLGITLALIAVGSWETWRSYRMTRELAARELRMVQLQGIVVHLDEVLTMSARMAANTGEIAWEARYRKAEPELDAAIKAMLHDAPDPHIRMLAEQTNAANAKLVAMENRAFELVRARDIASAEKIFGPEYLHQKELYADGMEATIEAVAEAMHDRMDTHRKRVFAEIVVAAIALVIVVLAWGRAVYQLRGREEKLRDALAATERDHAALSEAHHQLETLHAELVAKEKLAGLGLLAAGVAHEINNPMAYVTMNIHTMFEDMQSLVTELPADLRVYVDELLPATLDGIQRVNTIVRDLQQFARSDVDTSVPFDINNEIAAAARISDNQVKGRAVLDLDLAELPPITGKPRQMTQVFVNLIVNAAHALEGRTDGIIRIATKREGDHAVITIRDNGTGMSPETLARVFQPFFTTKGVGRGTGLGLSVVYGIVQAHDGTIDVESELGVGTCFRITLPVTTAEQEVSQAA